MGIPVPFHYEFFGGYVSMSFLVNLMFLFGLLYILILFFKLNRYETKNTDSETRNAPGFLNYNNPLEGNHGFDDSE